MLYLKKYLNSTKKFFSKILIILMCLWIIINPQASSESIKLGINTCINIVIPSLFPFIFIAIFTVHSQLFSKSGKVISKITEFLFCLPGYTAPIILLSLTGGYPVGARGVKALFEKNKINSEQLNRMMCFCVNAGPGFLISLVGNLLLGNKLLGIILLISQMLNSVLIGIFCAIHFRRKKSILYSNENPIQSQPVKISEAIVESTSCVCQTISEMCFFIIIFVFIISAIENSGIFQFIFSKIKHIGCYQHEVMAIFASLLEITSGCIKSSELKYGFLIIAFSVGFGGICTHLQIASSLKNCGFNFRKFCIFRLINAVFSFISAYIFIKYTEISSPVFSNISRPLSASNSSTVHGSIALILLSLYFIISVNLKLKPNKPRKKSHFKF